MNRWHILVIAFLLNTFSVAGELEYDQGAADKAATIRSLEIRTRFCLNESVKVMLRQGQRDSGQIIEFAARSCGSALSKFLTAGYGTKPMSGETAGAYIRTLAESELRGISGVSGFDSVPREKNSNDTPADNSETVQLGSQAFAERKYAVAMAFYRAAANHGSAEGQYMVGVIYRRGLLGKRLSTEAAVWYRKAADQGFPPAEYELGRFYDHGIGVQKDKEQALSWYKKAADHGYDPERGRCLPSLRNEAQHCAPGDAPR